MPPMSREDRLLYPPMDYQLPAAAALLPPSEPSFVHSYHPQGYPPPIPHLSHRDVSNRDTVLRENGLQRDLAFKESPSFRQSFSNRDIGSLRDNALLREPLSGQRDSASLRESGLLRETALSQPPPQPPPPPPPPPPVRPAPPCTENGGGSYDQFVHDLVGHPLLALLMKEVVETSGGRIEGENSGHFEEAQRKVRMVEDFTRSEGLKRALQWSSVDVFMTGLIGAIAIVKSGQGGMGVRLSISSSGWGRDRGGRIQKAGRTPLSKRARDVLDEWFKRNKEDPYPSVSQKAELARMCGMSLSSVNNWFGNKRMRIKRQMLTIGGGGGKVLAPKSKWHDVVVRNMNSSEGMKVMANATRGGEEGRWTREG